MNLIIYNPFGGIMPISYCFGRIKKHLQKIGFDENGVKFILQEFEKIIALYKDPEEAAIIIAEQFEKCIKVIFGQKEFEIFLKEINPYWFTQFEISEKLGIAPNELEFMKPFEVDEYWKDFNNFVKNQGDIRAQSYEKIKHDAPYEKLCKKLYRQFEPPDPLPDTIRLRLISVPMGGQPGYKRR